jgi:hypothetical protein
MWTFLVLLAESSLPITRSGVPSSVDGAPYGTPVTGVSTVVAVIAGLLLIFGGRRGIYPDAKKLIAVGCWLVALAVCGYILGFLVCAGNIKSRVQHEEHKE